MKVVYFRCNQHCTSKSEKESSLPTTSFEGGAVGFRECTCLFSLGIKSIAFAFGIQRKDIRSSSKSLVNESTLPIHSPRQTAECKVSFAHLGTKVPQGFCKIRCGRHKTCNLDLPLKWGRGRGENHGYVSSLQKRCEISHRSCCGWFFSPNNLRIARCKLTSFSYPPTIDTNERLMVQKSCAKTVPLKGLF